MDKIMNFLNGKKTYIFAFIAVAIKIADIYGMLEPKMYETLMVIDLGLLGGAVRHALSKIK